MNWTSYQRFFYEYHVMDESRIGSGLLKKKMFVYSSDYLEPVVNPFLGEYKDPLESSGKVMLHEEPWSIFKNDISNRIEYSSVMSYIKEPVDVLLSSITGSLKDHDNVFLIGSRAFNHNYVGKSALENVSIKSGNYDILHVTNKPLNKGTIIDSVLDNFVWLQTILHKQYKIPTILRLINRPKSLRDELCLYSNCTGIMLDMVGWNSMEEIVELTGSDIKKGIMSDEDQFESIVFFNSILVDNPKRFDMIIHKDITPMPILNKVGVNLFFSIVGERMYKSFPVDYYRKKILSREISDKLGYGLQMYSLYNGLLYNPNVPKYQNEILLSNIIDSISPDLLGSYTESIVEYFRGYVNVMSSRIHHRFETELKGKAFIILTGGDAFKRYTTTDNSQDYDYKVICQASKPGSNGKRFDTIGKTETITLCYKIITEELLMFMFSINRLINQKVIDIPVVKESNVSTNKYNTIELNSTLFNPNTVNFRLRKGDKSKTRIYSVDFRSHIFFHYAMDSTTVNEKMNFDIPLIDIGIIDSYDFDSTKSISELKSLYQYSDGDSKPVASSYFLLKDLYKTWVTPSMYKSRFKKFSKDVKRASGLTSISSFENNDFGVSVDNKYLSKYDVMKYYTLPDSELLRYYKKVGSDDIVFANTFKKSFDISDWIRNHKSVKWENKLYAESKNDFNHWVKWGRVTRSKSYKKREIPDEPEPELEPEFESKGDDTLDLDLSKMSLSDVTPTLATVGDVRERSDLPIRIRNKFKIKKYSPIKRM
ncbi:hypothetical protein SAGO17_0047 [Mimivirus AB-566-O17]|uniref:Uncharacterized protein n=1 Tax=Mimivirus AB-566-O17 TaxID=1988039 RepID=A0A1X9VNS9_9VIRU|nr:hypothetical protein SAGO17_0047 [Mimivirus AB-566-O17]